MSTLLQPTWMVRCDFSSGRFNRRDEYVTHHICSVLASPILHSDLGQFSHRHSRRLSLAGTIKSPAEAYLRLFPLLVHRNDHHDEHSNIEDFHSTQLYRYHLEDILAAYGSLHRCHHGLSDRLPLPYCR